VLSNATTKLIKTVSLKNKKFPAAIIGLAVVGLVYGIGSALGSDWIDNKTNDWGRKLIYKR